MGVNLGVNLPARVAPCEFGMLGGMVAVRCPARLRPSDAQGRATEPGSRRWLIEPRRIGPVIHALRRDTDPLRQAGIELDEGVIAGWWLREVPALPYDVALALFLRRQQQRSARDG